MAGHLGLHRAFDQARRWLLRVRVSPVTSSGFS